MEEYCKISGQSKTGVVERALQKYLEDTSSQNACPVLLGRTYIMV